MIKCVAIILFYAFISTLSGSKSSLYELVMVSNWFTSFYQMTGQVVSRSLVNRTRRSGIPVEQDPAAPMNLPTPDTKHS